MDQVAGERAIVLLLVRLDVVEGAGYSAEPLPDDLHAEMELRMGTVVPSSFLWVPIGRNEFMVLIRPEISEAAILAQAIVERLEVKRDGVEVVVNIGIAQRARGEEAKSFIRRADDAARASRELAGGGFRSAYEPSVDLSLHVYEEHDALSDSP